jgi:GH25 family lysozyme M1 (1,4-beta-N-acetylmuramidase)
MEIRGIDVSAWQGKIDWKTVADTGNDDEHEK